MLAGRSRSAGSVFVRSVHVECGGGERSDLAANQVRVGCHLRSRRVNRPVTAVLRAALYNWAAVPLEGGSYRRADSLDQQTTQPVRPLDGARDRELRAGKPWVRVLDQAARDSQRHECAGNQVCRLHASTRRLGLPRPQPQRRRSAPVRCQPGVACVSIRPTEVREPAAEYKRAPPRPDASPTGSNGPQRPVHAQARPAESARSDVRSRGRGSHLQRSTRRGCGRNPAGE